MAIRWEPKRPNEVRRFVINWASWLEEDTIATSDVTVDGVTLDSESNDDTTVTITLSGGTEGTLARITNTITTAGGDTETEVFTLYVSSFPEPVSLAELKEHVGVLGDERDSIISAYARAARDYCERSTDHVLVRRQITERRARFEDLFIYRRPFISADAVDYVDTDGVDQTFAGDLLTDLYLWPVRIRAEQWPSVEADRGVSITYTAGYAEGEVPETFVQAIKLLVGHWFANREAVAPPQVGAPHEVPFTVDALLDRHRAVIV
jgi:uncharacterized phiE125 gp8 family phage protein